MSNERPKLVLINSTPSINALRDPVSVASERLYDKLDGLKARSRGPIWRSALYAFLGALLVVAAGVWLFRFETNTGVPALHPHRGGPVMVTLHPG